MTQLAWRSRSRYRPFKPSSRAAVRRLERAAVQVERREANADFPHFLADLDGLVSFRRGRRQVARRADPENAMAAARQLHRDLLRPLEAEFVIENRQDYDVIVPVRSMSAGARGRVAGGANSSGGTKFAIAGSDGS